MAPLFHLLLSLSLVAFAAADNWRYTKPTGDTLDVSKPITIEWQIDSDSLEAEYTSLDLEFYARTDSGYFISMLAQNMTVSIGTSSYEFDPSEVVESLHTRKAVLSTEKESFFKATLYGDSPDMVMERQTKAFSTKGYEVSENAGSMMRPVWGLSILMTGVNLLIAL